MNLPTMHVIGRFVALAAALNLVACGATTTPVVPRTAVLIQPTPIDSRDTAYAGEVRAEREPVLAFQVGGVIARRSVDVGTPVKAGQALAELDVADLELRLAADEAAVREAASRRRLAAAERDRVDALLKRGLIGRAERDIRQTALEAADAQLQQTRSMVAAARRQSDYGVLRAPQDGVITARHVEIGQVVVAGQPAFTLAIDGPRDVAIALPEGNADAMRVGDPVSIAFWREPERRVAGEVREVAPAADAATRMRSVRIRVTGAGASAELGSSARVYARQSVDALRVPLSAVLQSDDGPGVLVFDPKTSMLRRTPVEIGAFMEDGALLQGIDADTWIAAAGVHVLRDGDHVIPVDHRNRRIATGGAQP